MKYSKQATVAYAGALGKEECLEPLNDFIIREGYSEGDLGFAAYDELIDMDCVEHLIASYERRSPLKSMDSSFIADNDEVVFMEFRFNYQNLKNLDRQKLIDKVKGSTTALNNPTNLHKKYYFIFNSNLKQQAISRLNRMNPMIPQNYIAVDMRDVMDLFFSPETHSTHPSS
jgi:hypothetical protein